MAAAVEACANCGHERGDRFCPRCGQNDRDYKRSLWRLVADLIKETFEVDGRLPRTLRPMFLRPGQLAVEFSRNRRASYVSPIRLYLFASILFFFAVAVVLDPGPRGASPDEPDGVAQEEVGEPSAGERKAEPLAGKALAERPKKAQEKCADVDIARFQSALPPHRRRMLEEVWTRDEQRWLCVVMQVLAADWTHANPATSEETTVSDGVSESGHGANIGAAREREAHEGEPLAGTPPGPVSTFVFGAAVEGLHDWQAAASKLLDNLPLAMFVTLPAYALLLKVFFYSSGRYYTEHLVFAMHLHTFSFLVYTLTLVMPDTSILPGFFGKALGWVSTGLWLWVVAYSYLALRRYYRDGRFLTTIKWLVLGGCYAVLLIPGLLLSVVATLLFL